MNIHLPPTNPLATALNKLCCLDVSNELRTIKQSCYQSPRSSVGGIVGLWQNAEENQPLIGCLIFSLTHSLLIEMRAILIIQEAKCKLVYLTRLFIAS